MNRLSFQPGQTILHKLYPITKLIWLLLGSGLVFFLTNGYLLISLACFCLLILNLINPNIWHIRGFPVVFLTGFLLLCLYILFDKTGHVIFHPGIELLTITTSGLETGLRFAGRFLVIVFLSYLFILTTHPSGLAYALMKIGIPYRVGFMLVTALRLAPILEEEGRTIYKAQLVRGIRYDKSSLSKWFLLIQQFLTPLLISALRRVDKLVFSMEGRGFGKYPSALDLFVSIVLALFFTTLILINLGVLI
jgi:energy-coupling factor transport system permease protein